MNVTATTKIEVAHGQEWRNRSLTVTTRVVLADVRRGDAVVGTLVEINKGVLANVSRAVAG